MNGSDVVDGDSSRSGGLTDSGAVIVSGLATVVGLLLGVGSGVPVGTLVGALAARTFVRSVRSTASANNATRALGSTGLVVSTMLAVGASLLPRSDLGMGVVVIVTVAVAVASLESIGFDSHSAHPVVSALLQSVGVLVVVAGVSLAGIPSVGGLSDAFDILSGQLLVLLVAAQLGVVALSVLLVHARATLDQWVPGNPTGRFPILERVSVEASDIPRELWVVLGVQLVLAVVFSGLSELAVRGLTATLPGRIVYAVLTSPFLYAPLVVALCLTLSVLGLEILRLVLVRWGGYDPPAMAALAAGGGVFGAITVLVGSVSPLVATTTPFLARRGVVTDTLGFVPTLLLLFGVVLVAVTVLAVVYTFLRIQVSDQTVPGILAGSALLFVAAVLASERGAHPVVVFVGVALVLVLVDIGRRSRTLRVTGTASGTLEHELVHFQAVLVVVAVGVVLATLGLYVAVPLFGSFESNSLPIVYMALLSAVSFLVAMRTEGTS